MSDWKARAAERRDARRTRPDEPLARYKKRIKRKPYAVTAAWLFKYKGGPLDRFALGHYATRNDAEKALAVFSRQNYWHELRLEGPP